MGYESETSDNLKLIDFGLSKVTVLNTKMHVSCGSLSYVAPEVLKQDYDSQCDIWSVGVVVFILLFGYMPFSGSEVKQQNDILAGRYKKKPDVWKNKSQRAQDFVTKMLQLDPKIRYDATKALEDPFIKERSD